MQESSRESVCARTFFLFLGFMGIYLTRFHALRNYSYLCPDENKNRNIACGIAGGCRREGASAARHHSGGAGAGQRLHCHTDGGD